MKKTTPLAMCAVAALLPPAGIVGRALLLMKRRPLEKIYENGWTLEEYVAHAEGAPEGVK